MIGKSAYRKFTAAFATVAVVGASAVLVTVTAAPALAAGTVGCGAITCSVTSKVVASSSSDGGSGDSGSGSGSGGGESSGVPQWNLVFQKCSGWLASTMVKDPADGSTYNGQAAYPNPDLMDQASWSCTVWKGSGLAYVNCPFVNGKAAYGITKQYAKNDKAESNLIAYWCDYPLDYYLTPHLTNYKVVTGGEGQFVKVNSASGGSSYTASGVVTDRTGYRKTGYAYGNPSTFNASLDVTFDAHTGTTGNPAQPAYGYYSLRWHRDYALWQKKSWQGWMGAKDSYTFKGTTSDNTADPYTYSCSLDPALAPGIRTGVSFTPADCAKQQKKWECSPTSAPKIMGTSNNVTLMRDGSDVSVVRGNMVANGSGIRNIRDRKEYNSIVTSGDAAVSPLNGSDPNSSKQYFKADDWEWNTWTAYNPNSKGTLHFYWSSDNGKSWKYSTKYHFTADFLVPVQSSVNGTASQQWVTDQADCGSVTSNTVTVVRSANG